MAEDVERIITGIAPTLRDLRTKRRISLTDAAGHVGVSVSTMSRLESGERAPTLDLLIPLARLYGVALDDIVQAPPTGDPRIRPNPVKRHGMIYIPLTKSGGPIQAFKMILPGGRRPSETAQTHDGYEWLYVLSGTLDLQLGNTHTAIDTGEAAEFDTRTPHLIASANEQPVELLGLFSPQGERIHITGPWGSGSLRVDSGETNAPRQTATSLTSEAQFWSWSLSRGGRYDAEPDPVGWPR